MPSCLPGPVLMALRRVGPYHSTRIAAAAGLGLPLAILETRPASREYPWTAMDDLPAPAHRLTGAVHPETDPPNRLLFPQIQALLTQLQPSVIVSVGWADRAYQALLLEGHRRRIPLVIVSDSRQRDEPRSAAKEWLKRLLLGGYSAALVAGEESRAYLAGLGFPATRITQPWDVVDNAFFEQAAAAAPARLPHFLCVSRLVAKKNHLGLLDAYGAYQRQGGRWALQLVGSGPLQAAIEARISGLPDPQRVQLLPFRQLEELGRLYGQASAFVLASTSDQWGLVVNEAMAAGLPCLVSSACGCAADLVAHGVSGWRFDPLESASLTQLLHQAERQSAPRRAAMAAAARERLQAFSPARFATGLAEAVEWAGRSPRFSRRAAVTAQLLHRRP